MLCCPVGSLSTSSLHRKSVRGVRNATLSRGGFELEGSADGLDEPHGSLGVVVPREGQDVPAGQLELVPLGPIALERAVVEVVLDAVSLDRQSMVRPGEVGPGDEPATVADDVLQLGCGQAGAVRPGIPRASSPGSVPTGCRRDPSRRVHHRVGRTRPPFPSPPSEPTPRKGRQPDPPNGISGGVGLPGRNGHRQTWPTTGREPGAP